MEPTKTVKLKKASKLGAEQRRTGYLFILPNCIIFVLFFIIPAVLGFYYSLTEYNGFGSPEFIGFANYAKLFSDTSFYKILWHTFLYVLLTVPTVFVAALAIAMGLTRVWIRGRDFMRISVFWPTMISTVIVGLIWRWIFGENSGIVNYLLSLLKGSGLPWLTDSTLAMVTLVIATVWSKAGYFMIIFVGAIEAIPTSYYEAAYLDGAKPWQVFRRITFPLLKGVTKTNLTFWTINTATFYLWSKMFSPVDTEASVVVPVMYLYDTAFPSRGSSAADPGAAAAVGIVLAVIILAVYLIMNRLIKDDDIEL